MDGIDTKILSGIIGRIILAIAGAWFIKRGYDASQFGIDANTIGGTILEIAAFLWSWWQKQPHRSILKAQDAGAVVTATVPPSIAQTNSPVSAVVDAKGAVDVSKLSMVAAILLLFSAMLTGCKTGSATQPASPEQRLQAAAAIYQSSLTELISLRRAGVIDDSTALQIEPFRAAAWGALTQAQQAVIEGNADNVTTYLNIFSSALANWTEAVTTAKSKPAAPTPAKPSAWILPDRFRVQYRVAA